MMEFDMNIARTKILYIGTIAFNEKYIDLIAIFSLIYKLYKNFFYKSNRLTSFEDEMSTIFIIKMSTFTFYQFIRLVEQVQFALKKNEKLLDLIIILKLLLYSADGSVPTHKLCYLQQNTCIVLNKD